MHHAKAAAAAGAIMLPIDSIIPYARNSKTHPEEQITELAAMIAEFGFDQPIVVDGESVIIKGHGRRLAAIKLGLEEVPVVVRTDLTPAQVKAARIADNRVAERGGWDFEMLRLDLEELNTEDFAMDLVGFTDDEASRLLLGTNSRTGQDTEKNKEMSAGDFEKFAHECPKCGFGWNDDDGN